MIVSAKWENAEHTRAEVTIGDGKAWGGVHAGHRLWAVLQDWIGLGNTPDEPTPPPIPDIPPLTAEELYDMLLTKGVVGAGDRPRARP